jgi:hypothetical protein
MHTVLILLLILLRYYFLHNYLDTHLLHNMIYAVDSASLNKPLGSAAFLQPVCFRSHLHILFLKC